MSILSTFTKRLQHFPSRQAHGLLIVVMCLAGCGDQDIPKSPQPALKPAAAPKPEAEASAKPAAATVPSDPIETVSPPVPPAQHSPAETAARELLAHLIAGRSAEAAKTFSPEVLEALPADKLKATWEAVQAQAGAYQSVAKTAKEMIIEANQVVDLSCTFEKMPLVLRISYNGKKQVVGIFFRPPPKPRSPENDLAQQDPDVRLKTPRATLFGTIDWPKGDGPFPAVLLISGSGPNDRDGNQDRFSSDYLKKLGTALATHGIAVLRFDKRGSGRSRFTKGGERQFRFHLMVNDALGWLRLMRKHKKISRVGIIGHSQGSLVALMAAEQTRVDAVVSIAGAGQSIDKVLERQLTRNLATMPKLRDQALAILKQLAAEKMVEKVPPTLASVFRPSVQPFLISWMKYDPAAIIAKTSTPTLIIQGTRDIQVAVSDAEALKAAQKSAALALIEDMNHVLRHIATDAEQLPSYSNPQLPLAPALVPALVAFLEHELADSPSK